jgi:prolipoprotein diacylglyceryltransferase
LHGAILVGLIAAVTQARGRKFGLWLFRNGAATALPIARLVERPADFINQDICGQPTDLPRGVVIAAQHGVTPYNDLGQ